MKTRLLALLALLAAACSPQPHQIQGKLQLDGASPLPEGALVIVSLEDVSLADAPSRTLSRLELDANRPWPVAYRFTLPQDAFEAHRQYAVSARVVASGGQLLYINDSRYGVDPRQLEQELDLILVPVTPLPTLQ
ncbi:YbaY family lipoprotein [Gallaecimonas sp. GXIMD4217]|uniref:YbaY family lipoprotein n=1 Tax=Gallaecimonas sp. GXIMD4217 TaxID=3131927 RepID=UPI00311ACAFA